LGPEEDEVPDVLFVPPLGNSRASPFRVLGLDLFVERGLHESPLRERKPESRKVDLVSFVALRGAAVWMENV